MANYHVSPSHTHEKLEAPSYIDLVDVFEDRMLKWLLKPAEHLLTQEHGAVPAMALIISYFEGIEIYLSGQDSKGSSRDFFRRGFQKIFRPKAENEHFFNQVVDGLYVQARCGFAHDGLFRNRVFFSQARPEALNVTWPNKEGKFDPQGRIESIVINAPRFLDGVRKHFDQYIASLRAESDATLKANFLAAVELKWGLGEPPPAIGMTETDFFDGA